ncbi:MAG: MBL fold metallo-hydrolase [Cyclobacteriaceae bacterium]|nr:MBL fold metallo-hydrolase [Cyclobacteriaceae bacterium]
MNIKITFLGTGTSLGIPIVGCDCSVCRSTDPRDKRLRTSALIEAAGQNIVIDTGPDFRYQALRVGLRRLDAVIYTHEHRDHIAGLDDIRPFNCRQGGGDTDLWK